MLCTSRADIASKPAFLQPREFAVLTKPHKCPIDGLTQRLVVLGERDPELFVGRYLKRDRQLRAVLHQPRDNREQFDHQTDASSLEVVEVNINVNDLHLPDEGDDRADGATPRVQ